MVFDENFLVPMFIDIVYQCFTCVQGFKRYGSQKSRKVSSQSQFSDRGAEEDTGMEDTESLLSDENESGDHDEPNDINLCHNMPWIKVVNATASFLLRLVLSKFVNCLSG